MSRKSHRHLLPDVRDALATELRATRAAHGGSLPTPLVETFARQYAISARTVHRLAADPCAVPTQRSRFTLSDEQIAAIAAGPNRKKVWKDEVAAGRCTVGYPQFIRACNDTDPAVFAGAIDGLSAMAAKQGYLLREAPARNDMWIIDHYEVPVFVRWPKFRNPVKPWQTTLIDDKHRTVMGAIWWPKAPTADQVVAAVAAAVRGFTLPDGTFVGGSPQVLLMDQGAEMIGQTATAAYLTMRTDPQPAPARAPWVKGKLENFHGNILDPGYAVFPGWTGGPRDSAGRQILTTPVSELLDRNDFRDQAWALLAAYNASHEHSALGGLAPLESWLADPAPVRRIDDAILRQHWLTEQRTVSGKGVHMHNRPYQGPQLTHEGGRVLTVAYVPDDETFLDVQLSDGSWERAVPHSLPASMASHLLGLRAAQTRRVRAIHATARQLSAAAHAAARTAQPPAAPAAPPVTPVPPPAPATQPTPSPVAPLGSPTDGNASPPVRSRARRSTPPPGAATPPSPAPQPPAAGPARIRPVRRGRPDQDTSS